MSADYDDSSFQLERLISYVETSGSSIDKTVLDPQSLSSSTSEHPQSSIKNDTCNTDNKQLPDINACYSWLHQYGSRGPRKESESSNGSTNSTASSSSSSSSSFVSLPRPDPPDGGWGWMVVFGAFMVSLICDGLAYCFGVLYAELLAQFGESKSKTSLVGSIFFGVSMILGPFASTMTTRYGCRKITILGGLLSSLGFILSYFANSIEMIFISFSLIVGIGFSFCYITSVVIVAFYFKKRRALATGLAVCGTGVGTFTFAPFMDYLITEYGWRGLFLIMAGISLNLVVCGMLFRPLKFTEAERCHLLLEEFEKLPHDRGNLEFKRSRNQSESTEVSSSDMDNSEEDMRTLSMTSLPTFARGKIRDTSSSLLMEALKKGRNPHLTMQRFMKNTMLRLNIRDTSNTAKDRTHTLADSTFTISAPSDKSLDNMTSLARTSSNIVCTDLNKDSGLTLESVTFIPSTNGESENEKPRMKKSQMAVGKISTKKKSQISDMQKTLDNTERSNSSSSRIAAFSAGRPWAYGIHLPLFRSDIFYRRAIVRNAQLKSCTLGTSCPELTESHETKFDGNCCQKVMYKVFYEITDLCSDMFDLRLLTNGFFAAFTVSNILFYFWSDVPYMYAADHAMIQGASPREASFVISIIGIFNTIGQVFFGFVGDMKVNLIIIYAIVSVLSGIFVALIPLFSVYWKSCIFYALFGFCVSVGYPLTTVMMVNYLGMERLTSAYGLLMLMQGIANLCGPPFAGWVSDETGTYDSAFYLCGIFFVLSGLVMFLIYLPGCKATRIVSQQRSEFNDEQEISEAQADPRIIAYL